MFSALLACSGRAPPPAVCPPCVSVVPVCPSPALVSPVVAEIAGPRVALRDDQMKTKTVARWLPEDHVAKASGDIVASISNNGSTAVLPRPQLTAKLPALPFDLGAALERVEALSTKVRSSQLGAMEAELAIQEKKAPSGSLVHGRQDSATAHVQLSADRRTITFSTWWTVRTHIDGPLVSAPRAQCATGQPCAQMADYRRDASVSVTAGARYVVSRDGALLEEIVFVPLSDKR